MWPPESADSIAVVSVKQLCFTTKYLQVPTAESGLQKCVKKIPNHTITVSNDQCMWFMLMFTEKY